MNVECLIKNSKLKIQNYILIFCLLSPAVASAMPLVIEAQKMTVKQCANGHPVDSGYCCLGPGYLAETVEFSGLAASLIIVARGDYAGDDWPIMEVRINQVMVASITIDSATWKTFNLDLPSVAAGKHELAFAFVNDYYQHPDDRNFYLSKVTLNQQTEPRADVTLAWEASVSENVSGYKIYYGPMSRFDPSLDPVKILAELQKKCGSKPTQKCLDSWANYCKAPDLLCDYDFFDYDTVIDVGNVLTHTLNLPEGHYFIAASAYNDDKPYPEGRFSIELDHTVVLTKPGIKAPKNFKWKEVQNAKF